MNKQTTGFLLHFRRYLIVFLVIFFAILFIVMRQTTKSIIPSSADGITSIEIVSFDLWREPSKLRKIVDDTDGIKKVLSDLQQIDYSTSSKTSPVNHYDSLTVIIHYNNETELMFNLIITVDKTDRIIIGYADYPKPYMYYQGKWPSKDIFWDSINYPIQAWENSTWKQID